MVPASRCRRQLRNAEGGLDDDNGKTKGTEESSDTIVNDRW